MSKSDNIILDQSYKNQSKIFNDVSESGVHLAESWFDETTADYWRHNRMYEIVDCLKSDLNASWLTVGDGRWGLDSLRIRKRGFQDVMPTDICETLLKEAKTRGYIKTYSIENAEKLSFEDNAFDYVFCKESFHHFPRPYIALYEMLRVARKGVILVEPNDDPVPATVSFNKFLKYKAKSFLSRHGLCQEPAFWGTPYFYFGGYEDSGNFVYSLSKREMEKVCNGLNYSQLVWKGLNDHYIKGCEFEKADKDSSPMFKEIYNTIAKQDEKCKQGKGVYSIIMIGLFKDYLDESIQREFKNHGFVVKNLEKNPHIK